MGSIGTVHAGDLFCGAGGLSKGLALACEDLDEDVELVCVNHDPQAIETHQENHPWATHLCKDIHTIDPLEAIPGRHLDFLGAGPECIYWSGARGGKPCPEQKRATPWTVLNWLEKLHVENFVIENVPEFRNWCPTDQDGNRIKEKSGDVFEAYIQQLSALGYSVEYEVLNAADYGDPTTRRRLFIVGTREGRPPWPEPTHAEDSGPEDPRERWRSAAEVIDWSDTGHSIWARGLMGNGKKPLVETTMGRIAAGLRRYCDEPVSQFADVVEDLGREEVGALQEEAVPVHKLEDALEARDGPVLVRASLRIHANGDRNGDGLGVPYILGQHGGAVPRDVTEEPVNTVATRGAISLVLPRLQFYRGEDSNPAYPADDRPLHTVTAKNHDGHVIRPYLVPFYGERESQDPRTHDVDEPLPTVPASKTPAGPATPYLVRYYGNGDADPVDEPLGTVTTRDRFALVLPDLFPWGLDIRFRMLQPRELAAAMGFPESYTFLGNKTETVRQIGNAIPVNLARALCRSILGETGDPSLLDYQGETTPATAAPEGVGR